VGVCVCMCVGVRAQICVCTCLYVMCIQNIQIFDFFLGASS